MRDFFNLGNSNGFENVKSDDITPFGGARFRCITNVGFGPSSAPHNMVPPPNDNPKFHSVNYCNGEMTSAQAKLIKKYISKDEFVSSFVSTNSTHAKNIPYVFT